MKKADRLQLDDQLCFALYAATNAVIRSYRPRLKRLGLTYPQYLVMLVLWQDGEHTVQEIADRLSLKQNAISPLLTRLAASKLIKRKRDRKDARITRISLTAKGEKLERKAADAQFDVACETGLTRAELDKMREELKTMTEYMESL